MKTVETEVYSEESNHAVIRAPGRRFPGSLIQGDSLSILCSEARTISLRLRQLGVNDAELLAIAQEHQEKLLGRLLHYQRVLDEHRLALPSHLEASPTDL